MKRGTLDRIAGAQAARRPLVVVTRLSDGAQSCVDAGGAQQLRGVLLGLAAKRRIARPVLFEAGWQQGDALDLCPDLLPRYGELAFAAMDGLTREGRGEQARGAQASSHGEYLPRVLGNPRFEVW